MKDIEKSQETESGANEVVVKAAEEEEEEEAGTTERAKAHSAGYRRR